MPTPFHLARNVTDPDDARAFHGRRPGRTEERSTSMPVDLADFARVVAS